MGTLTVIVAGRYSPRIARTMVARGALALQVHVVVREVLHAECQVGGLQELFVLVAVRIERRGQDGGLAHDLAHPSRDVGLRPLDAAHRHGPVQCHVHAIERAALGQVVEHDAEEVFVGFVRDPARADARLGKERRLDAHQLDFGVFPGALHETAEIAFGVVTQQHLVAAR